jgi:hypothetical protein
MRAESPALHALRGEEAGYIFATNRMTARQFVIGLIAVITLFLALEARYIAKFPLVMDEFVDAETVYGYYAHAVPYRDFAPNKTVLARYVELPLLELVRDPWTALLVTKFEIALLAALAIAFAAVTLARLFGRGPTLAALILLVCMNTFNERCAELRTDMPAAAAGLLSLMLLIRKRPGWAGVACSVALMMSQKAAYFVLASEAALVLPFLVRRDAHRFRELIAFNVAAISAFLAYLGFWSLLSSPRAVYEATFVGPTGNAFGDFFGNTLRARYWPQTLSRNPFFYALSGAALLFLGVKGLRHRDAGALTLFGYAAALIALCIWHKQPWPYFFVFLIPTLFVIQAPLLEAAIARLSREGRSAWLVAAALVLVFGVVLPLGSRLPATLARNSDYQQSTFRLADAILHPGEQYLAGVPMLFRRTQAVPEQFNSLDSTERARIAAMPIAKMLSVIQQLSRTPTKFVILNYRLIGLPQPLNLYLRVTFEPFWGSIFIYSPRIGPGHFDLAFDGAYFVKSAAAVSIDGAPATGIVQLRRGPHIASASAPFRLTFQPQGVERWLDPRFRDYEELFFAVYDF